jgi:hypothetical protein
MPRKIEWSMTVALAGIAATAVVGLAAASVTFFVAREDRQSAAAVARQSLVYDKRSEAYVDVLVSLQGLSTNARLRKYELLPRGWPEFQAEHAPLRAQITAFGSSRAIPLYNRMYFAASRFVADALAADIAHASEAEKQAFWVANSNRRQFDQVLRQFEGVAQREVGELAVSGSS